MDTLEFGGFSGKERVVIKNPLDQNLKNHFSIILKKPIASKLKSLHRLKHQMHALDETNIDSTLKTWAFFLPNFIFDDVPEARQLFLHCIFKLLAKFDDRSRPSKAKILFRKQNISCIYTAQFDSDLPVQKSAESLLRLCFSTDKKLSKATGLMKKTFLQTAGAVLNSEKGLRNLIPLWFRPDAAKLLQSRTTRIETQFLVSVGEFFAFDFGVSERRQTSVAEIEEIGARKPKEKAKDANQREIDFGGTNSIESFELYQKLIFSEKSNFWKLCFCKSNVVRLSALSLLNKLLSTKNIQFYFSNEAIFFAKKCSDLLLADFGSSIQSQLEAWRFSINFLNLNSPKIDEQTNILLIDSTIALLQNGNLRTKIFYLLIRRLIENVVKTRFYPQRHLYFYDKFIECFFNNKSTEKLHTPELLKFFVSSFTDCVNIFCGLHKKWGLDPNEASRLSFQAMHKLVYFNLHAEEMHPCIDMVVGAIVHTVHINSIEVKEIFLRLEEITLNLRKTENPETVVKNISEYFVCLNNHEKTSPESASSFATGLEFICLYNILCALFDQPGGVINRDRMIDTCYRMVNKIGLDKFQNVASLSSTENLKQHLLNAFLDNRKLEMDGKISAILLLFWEKKKHLQLCCEILENTKLMAKWVCILNLLKLEKAQDLDNYDNFKTLVDRKIEMAFSFAENFSSFEFEDASRLLHILIRISPDIILKRVINIINFDTENIDEYQTHLALKILYSFKKDSSDPMFPSLSIIENLHKLRLCVNKDISKWANLTWNSCLAGREGNINIFIKSKCTFYKKHLLKKPEADLQNEFINFLQSLCFDRIDQTPTQNLFDRSSQKACFLDNSLILLNFAKPSQTKEKISILPKRVAEEALPDQNAIHNYAENIVQLIQKLRYQTDLKNNGGFLSEIWPSLLLCNLEHYKVIFECGVAGPKSLQALKNTKAVLSYFRSFDEKSIRSAITVALSFIKPSCCRQGLWTTYKSPLVLSATLDFFKLVINDHPHFICCQSIKAFKEYGQKLMKYLNSNSSNKLEQIRFCRVMINVVSEISSAVFAKDRECEDKRQYCEEFIHSLKSVVLEMLSGVFEFEIVSEIIFVLTSVKNFDTNFAALLQKTSFFGEIMEMLFQNSVFALKNPYRSGCCLGAVNCYLESLERVLSGSGKGETDHKYITFYQTNLKTILDFVETTVEDYLEKNDSEKSKEEIEGAEARTNCFRIVSNAIKIEIYLNDSKDYFPMFKKAILLLERLRFNVNFAPVLLLSNFTVVNRDFDNIYVHFGNLERFEATIDDEFYNMTRIATENFWRQMLMHCYFLFKRRNIQKAVAFEIQNADMKNFVELLCQHEEVSNSKKPMLFNFLITPGLIKGVKEFPGSKQCSKNRSLNFLLCWNVLIDVYHSLKGDLKLLILSELETNFSEAFFSLCGELFEHLLGAFSEEGYLYYKEISLSTEKALIEDFGVDELLLISSPTDFQERIGKDETLLSKRLVYLTNNDLLHKRWFFEKLSIRLYFRILFTFPSLMRSWFLSLDRHRSKIISKFTQKYFSSVVIRKEKTKISQFIASTEDMQSTKELNSHSLTIIHQSKDDLSFSLSLSFPADYPLNKINFNLSETVNVRKNSHFWIPKLVRQLNSMKGSVSNAIGVWRQNITKLLEGVSECPICFAIVHTSTKGLPGTSCKVCGGKFHSVCIIKWFASSGKPQCPLCRSFFGEYGESAVYGSVGRL